MELILNSLVGSGLNDILGPKINFGGPVINGMGQIAGGLSLDQKKSSGATKATGQKNGLRNEPK